MPQLCESARVLVTGATGAVGTRVAESLHQHGCRVRRLQRSRAASSPDTSDIVLGDITHPELLSTAVAGCEIVVHCAGEKRDEPKMARVNVEGTRNLIEAARQHGVRIFCHLSSAGVTGFTRDAVITESTPARPMNTYEQTKLDAECIVASTALPGGRTVILRPTNVFDDSIVSAANITAWNARLKLTLKGNEHAHLVYAEDVAAAVHHVLTADLPSGETYLVSSDDEGPFTHGWVTRRLSELLGCPNRQWPACPAVVPWLLRSLQNGRANRGTVLYSGQKLAETGFSMPFGVKRGLAAAVQSSRRGLHGNPRLSAERYAA